MLTRRYHIYIICSLKLLGMFLFARGYFPRKQAVLSGYATTDYEDASRLFDKVVFTMIDALRSDFVFGLESNMHHLHEMINAGSAVPFTARASTPTVTLPRLKCLTTGSIPGFLDAILNIAESDSSSTLASQDSWIEQMKLDNRRINMFGDDTWLRLFPNAFHTSEGTSSFFVNDFTEVDNNVTRHLNHELTCACWDTLILHYLGLDHIGHLEGPNSPHMASKQEEMDGIVARIHTENQKADQATGTQTLQIVVGDHGMTNDGNHGGSTDAETHTALVLISDVFKGMPLHNTDKQNWPPEHKHEFRYYDQVLQSDIGPFLSIALGLPIPQNSLGLVPRTMLAAWNESDQRRVVAQNAKQLQRLIVAGNAGQQRISTQLACSNGDSGSGKCTLREVQYLATSSLTRESFIDESYSLMQAMQKSLLSASNDFGIRQMYSGITLLALATIYAILWQSDMLLLNISPVWLLPILHSMTAFATSFVEEEHAFWYYMTSIGLLMLAIRSSSSTKSGPAFQFIGLLCFRILRRYNQTGQKHAGAPDIAGLVAQTFGPSFSPYFYFLMMQQAFGQGVLEIRSFGVSNVVYLVTFGVVTRFKYALPGWNDQLFWGQLSWLMIGISFLAYTRTRNAYMMPMMLLYFQQTKSENHPIGVLFWFIHESLQKQQNVPWTIATLVALQQASFYALGNSNSLSGLDLSQAYNGVSGYNEVLVGVLLFISAFIGPLFWHFSLRNYCHGDETRKTFARKFMVTSSCLYSLALCVSCDSMKHHLFVFSVFSPKLLYAASWAVYNSLMVLIL